MLRDGVTADETKTLGAFEYERVNCTVHCDESLLPSNKKDWRGFNWLWLPGEDRSEVTLLMNHPGLTTLGMDAPLFLQTVNPASPIAAGEFAALIW
jgi:predicted NAD/FAD-binding protein